MVAGQSLDLLSEEQGIKDEKELYNIHSHKTADMLIASILAGAYCSSTTDSQLKCLEAYGEKIGLLFQITDDILDASGSRELMGKSVHKDGEVRNKLTYVTLYGIDEAREKAQVIAAEAERLLFSTFGDNCKYLYDTVNFIINRSC